MNRQTLSHHRELRELELFVARPTRVVGALIASTTPVDLQRIVFSTQFSTERLNNSRRQTSPRVSAPRRTWIYLWNMGAGLGIPCPRGLAFTLRRGPLLVDRRHIGVAYLDFIPGVILAAINGTNENTSIVQTTTPRWWNPLLTNSTATDLQVGAVVVDYPREHPGSHQSPVEESGKPRLLSLSHRREEDES